MSSRTAVMMTFWAGLESRVARVLSAWPSVMPAPIRSLSSWVNSSTWRMLSRIGRPVATSLLSLPSLLSLASLSSLPPLFTSTGFAAGFAFSTGVLTAAAAGAPDSVSATGTRPRRWSSSFASRRPGALSVPLAVWPARDLAV